jgi:hypothetical protein
MATVWSWPSLWRPSPNGASFPYWTLVGIVNGWPDTPVANDSASAWE